MKITYDEISSDSKKIVNAMSSSKRVVPSAFHPLKRVLKLFSLFLLFCGVDYVVFVREHQDSIGEWLLFFAFGVINWLFLFAFFYGYEIIFSMLDEKSVSELKFVKIIKRKIKNYGVFWAACIALLGIVGAMTEFNIGLLVIGNFVGSLFLIFTFNVDISRYQISALIGAVSAVRDNIKG